MVPGLVLKSPTYGRNPRRQCVSFRHQVSKCPIPEPACISQAPKAHHHHSRSGLPRGIGHGTKTNLSRRETTRRTNGKISIGGESSSRKNSLRLMLKRNLRRWKSDYINRVLGSSPSGITRILRLKQLKSHSAESIESDLLATMVNNCAMCCCG